MKIEGIDSMINFNKPFAEAFRAGEVDVETVHDYIEYWHTHETGNGLQEFLGMTKKEYVAWLRNPDRYLPDILGVEMAPPEMPVCKMCGEELGVRLDDGRIICRSSYIEDNDYCHECQVEHCLSTNCLKCEMGEYPHCRHLDLKKCYLEEERLEREEEEEEAKRKQEAGDASDS